MNLIDRIKRIIAVVEESNDSELCFLVDLLEEKSKSEEDLKPKRGRPKKVAKIGRNSKYSNRQIVKAFKMRKKGISRANVAKVTGIKKGSLTNSHWLNDQYEKIQTGKR